MSRIPNSSIDALALLIDWNLATLEELKMLKSSSASRIQRQQRICDEGVRYFRQFGTLAVAKRMECSNLADVLEGT